MALLIGEARRHCRRGETDAEIAFEDGAQDLRDRPVLVDPRHRRQPGQCPHQLAAPEREAAIADHHPAVAEDRRADIVVGAEALVPGCRADHVAVPLHDERVRRADVSPHLLQAEARIVVERGEPGNRDVPEVAGRRHIGEQDRVSEGAALHANVERPRRQRRRDGIGRTNGHVGKDWPLYWGHDGECSGKGSLRVSFSVSMDRLVVPQSPLERPNNTPSSTP